MKEELVLKNYSIPFSPTFSIFSSHRSHLIEKGERLQRSEYRKYIFKKNQNGRRPLGFVPAVRHTMYKFPMITSVITKAAKNQK